jgi:hypothetical protein
MTYTSTPPTATTSDSAGSPPEPSDWVGLIFFASIVMLVVGTFQGIAGVTALFKDDYFLVRSNGLIFSVNYTAWGWTHLLLGVLTLAAAAGVLSGNAWARAWGIAMAMIGAVVNVGFLAAYPVWSVIMITLDVLVIWALAVHGSETRDRA